MINRPENLREPKKHGTVQFPLAVYQMEGEAVIVPHHWHEEIELIYLETGDYLLDINMEKMPKRERCFYFVNKEELHYLKVQTGCMEQAVVFNLRLLAFEEYDRVQQLFITPLQNGRLRFPKMVLKESEPGQLLYREFMEVIRQNENNKQYSYLRMKASLMNILAVLEEYGLMEKTKESEEANQDKITAIKMVLTHIKQHYKEKIYIRDLAQLVNLNEQYLCRFFKKAIGKTLVEYIIEYRVERAAEQLAQRDGRIMEVCFNCGFENAGYFIRKFKQLKGCTPSVYRASIMENSIG